MNPQKSHFTYPPGTVQYHTPSNPPENTLHPRKALTPNTATHPVKLHSLDPTTTTALDPNSQKSENGWSSDF